jgi:GNAT superfamily N-acetyltransferase
MSADINNLLRLGPKHVKPASEVLARAFFKDAETSYYFPDNEKRAQKLPHLFRSAVLHGIHHGEVYATPNLEGIAIWIPSDMLDIPFWRFLLYGGLLPLFRVNPMTLWRLKSSDNYLSGLHKQLAPFPHWYLSLLGVDPQFQGNGYASQLMRPMLQRLDKENMPAYLETQTEKNVSIYQAYGFKVIEKGITPVSKIETWIMLRKNAGT